MQAINVDATLKLAQIARHAGVKKFIFVSSARVYGLSSEETYRENQPTTPCDPYGVSKAVAEEKLNTVFAGESERLLVLRAPVMHAPGRGGVLGLVARLANVGFMLPDSLGTAPKSILHVRNLASVIACGLGRDQHFSGIFNISDGEPVSLQQIGQIIASANRRDHALLRLPVWVPAAMKALPVIGGALAHLRHPCVLDCSKLRLETGWIADLDTSEALAQSFGNAGRSGTTS